MLPVDNTIGPNLLDSAISTTPRARDWRFSSVVSGLVPLKGVDRMALKEAMVGSTSMMS